MTDGIDNFTVLGIGRLIVGSIVLPSDHMELMQVQECGGFFRSTNDQAARRWTLVRLGGMVAGAIGGVVTITSAAR